MQGAQDPDLELPPADLVEDAGIPVYTIGVGNPAGTADREVLDVSAGAAALTGAVWGGRQAAAQVETPDTLNMDYAYYNSPYMFGLLFGLGLYLAACAAQFTQGVL